MSLKVEQRLNNDSIAENQPRIYSTGVYLVPLQVTNNGKAMFVWVADEFDDTSYIDGKECSPNVLTKSIDTLLVSSEL